MFKSSRPHHEKPRRSNKIKGSGVFTYFSQCSLYVNIKGFAGKLMFLLSFLRICPAFQKEVSSRQQGAKLLAVVVFDSDGGRIVVGSWQEPENPG